MTKFNGYDTAEEYMASLVQDIEEIENALEALDNEDSDQSQDGGGLLELIFGWLFK